MPRIAGIDLPGEKRIEISLTYIFGIGMTTAKKILDQTGVGSQLVGTVVFDVKDGDAQCLASLVRHHPDHRLTG